MNWKTLIIAAVLPFGMYACTHKEESCSDKKIITAITTSAETFSTTIHLNSGESFIGKSYQMEKDQEWAIGDIVAVEAVGPWNASLINESHAAKFTEGTLFSDNQAPLEAIVVGQNSVILADGTQWYVIKAGSAMPVKGDHLIVKGSYPKVASEIRAEEQLGRIFSDAQEREYEFFLAGTLLEETIAIVDKSSFHVTCDVKNDQTDQKEDSDMGLYLLDNGTWTTLSPVEGASLEENRSYQVASAFNGAALSLIDLESGSYVAGGQVLGQMIGEPIVRTVSAVSTKEYLFTDGTTLARTLTLPGLAEDAENPGLFQIKQSMEGMSMEFSLDIRDKIDLLYKIDMPAMNNKVDMHLFAPKDIRDRLSPSDLQSGDEVTFQKMKITSEMIKPYLPMFQVADNEIQVVVAKNRPSH